ncbi:MAG: zf-TFIIB domain-containing protein, partial [Pyrinomonadaceae bacterium]
KTMACPSCFGLIFIGSKFCGHCGAIAAPVETGLDDAECECPRCRSQLEKLQVGQTVLRSCSKCNGLWVDVETFETICADREKQSAVLGFLDERTVPPHQLTKITYIPCPDCGQLMNRNNFAKASGVIVDICKKHGVWFDTDELSSIVEFIRKGGMELARNREKLEIQEQRDKLRDDLRRQRGDESKFDSTLSRQNVESSAIRSFVASLFK